MAAAAVDMCVECEDQEAAVRCTQCDEFFCRPCYQMQHRKGKRRLHQNTPLLGELMPKPAGEAAGVAAAENGAAAAGAAAASAAAAADMDTGGDQADEWEAVVTHRSKKQAAASGELYRFIPLRLNARERDMFAVLEGTLSVSEYTDNVDVLRWGKDERMCEEMDEVCREIIGLLCCNDFREGSRRAAVEVMSQNEDFFREVFEIGRRYKTMNPEKMRTTYGKLMFMLQDAVSSSVRRHIRMNVVAPIKTVQGTLDNAGAARLLEDPDFETATDQIPSGASKAEAAELRAAKEAATGALVERYASDRLPAAEVERVILSVADSRTYQDIACRPIRAMINYLTTCFPSSSPEGTFQDLQIGYGQGGSKLSHSHSTQYKFVLQSLTLWHKMCSRMFYLWACADEDLLGDHGYRLCNTGQGLNRVQTCPAVSRAANGILREVQSEVGSWVGLSVVHLGDRDVPNALVFIDKYTQVPRILAPIVQTVSQLETLAKDPAIESYFKSTFGGVASLRQMILRDFFRHGFDGSGDDGGSCIDGRLTSAWNWCSKLEKKKYYRVFLLAGFTGFDGDWRAG